MHHGRIGIALIEIMANNIMMKIYDSVLDQLNNNKLLHPNNTLIIIHYIIFYESLMMLSLN